MAPAWTSWRSTTCSQTASMLCLVPRSPPTGPAHWNCTADSRPGSAFYHKQMLRSVLISSKFVPRDQQWTIGEPRRSLWAADGGACWPADTCAQPLMTTWTSARSMCCWTTLWFRTLRGRRHSGLRWATTSTDGSLGPVPLAKSGLATTFLCTPPCSGCGATLPHSDV